MAYVIDKRIIGKPKEKYWITYIKQRIRKNKNFLGFVSGQTGSGKSYSCLRIGEELDPDFNIDRVVFSGLELMKLINSGKLKKGSYIVFEETGVAMSNKNWQSVTNKMLNYLLQTFRNRNFVLIMNSLYMDFVDSATRKLFHAEMQTQGIDLKKNEVLLKPQLIQYNGRLKKFYYKRLRILTERGKVPVNIWKVAKPSEKLRKEYEQKKTKYTDELNVNIQEELEAIENKGKKNPLTDIQQDVLKLLKDGLTIPQIATIRDRAETSIHESIRLLKNKGYKFNAIKGEDHRKVLKYEVISP